MFAFIRGILRETGTGHVVLEAGGIGYEILVPANLIGTLPEIGKELALFTALIIRENEHTLYGFGAAKEKQLFLTVTGVSGIGPKLGLALLGHLSVADFQMAIESGNSQTLCRIPGVGKRTAERMVVELKDRLSALFPRDHSDTVKEQGDSGAQILQDALSALVNLGYTQVIAQKAITECKGELSKGMVLSEFIACVLKKI